MSWAEDVKTQWANLPPWGKALILGGIGVVAFLVIRSMGQGRSAPQLAGDSSEEGQPMGRSIFPGIQSGQSNVPLLPSNVNPVFSGGGQLVGFQESAPPPSQVGATPNAPSNNLTSGLLGSNVAVDLKKRTYINAEGKETALPISSNAQLIQGKQNRVWYVDNGTQYLLTSGTGPAVTNSGYPQGSPQNTPGAYGGGGRSWQSMMYRLTNYTPQMGDNMNEVAMKLGLRGGWQAFRVPSFEHGRPVRIPY